MPADFAARIGRKSISLVYAAEVQGLPSGVGPLSLSCTPFGPLAFGDGHRGILAGGGLSLGHYTELHVIKSYASLAATSIVKIVAVLRETASAPD